MDVAGSLTANREEGGGGAGGRGRTGDHPGRPSCLCASRGRCTGGWGAASQWSRDLSNHLICSPKLYFSSPSSAEDAIAILSSENRIARNMIFRVNASALHINIINYISLIFTLNLYVIFIRVDCNLYLHVSILKFVLMNME
ncbi:hypothetical protein PVAP13_4KG372700 [Panicum virgatum]|uniref:Uncharacterized protein n=1 Tax=Panicum virgatum TaxID=38727 RepID=A0A8T0TTD1_PANVG|nr:hypothetical protein PVAP13_4KG372700 [Panicum virgatum]